MKATTAHATTNRNTVLTPEEKLLFVVFGDLPKMQKILTPVFAPIAGNIDETLVYKIHDGFDYARVRIEKGQCIEDLIDILGDLQELVVHGRHAISRIHLFTAKNTSGDCFDFAATYSQIFKIAILTGLDSCAPSMAALAEHPINMSRSFRPMTVLSSDMTFVARPAPDRGVADTLATVGMEKGW
jgi:hypothetical protein